MTLQDVAKILGTTLQYYQKAEYVRFLLNG